MWFVKWNHWVQITGRSNEDELKGFMWVVWRASWRASSRVFIQTNPSKYFHPGDNSNLLKLNRFVVPVHPVACVHVHHSPWYSMICSEYIKNIHDDSSLKNQIFSFTKGTRWNCTNILSRYCKLIDSTTYTTVKLLRPGDKTIFRMNRFSDL